jgi:hypothetical protein
MDEYETWMSTNMSIHQLSKTTESIVGPLPSCKGQYHQRDNPYISLQAWTCNEMNVSNPLRWQYSGNTRENGIVVMIVIFPSSFSNQTLLFTPIPFCPIESKHKEAVSTFFFFSDSLLLIATIYFLLLLKIV